MSIYQQIYDLILHYVYGDSLPLSGELVVDLLSTIGCVLAIAFPFILVYAFVKAVFRF